MTDHDTALAQLAGVRHEHLLFYARRAYEQVHGLRPRRYGVSSNALTDYALGLRPEPGTALYPKDKGDLEACELTYETAPADLQPLMLPVLEKYQVYVWEHLVHTDGCQMRTEPPAGFPFKTFSCNCRGVRSERANG